MPSYAGPRTPNGHGVTSQTTLNLNNTKSRILHILYISIRTIQYFGTMKITVFWGVTLCNLTAHNVSGKFDSYLPSYMLE
jgi:hypothetical protein